MPQPAAQREGDPEDKEFMTTLAKGLAVLGLFGRERPTMTLSEAPQVADLSRATARRVLRTLTQLGYVEQEGRTFSLAPRSSISASLICRRRAGSIARCRLMRELSERLGESCSAAILQGTDIVYVARVPARRIMSVAISIGTRLPAFHTAVGRVHAWLSRRRRDLAATEVAAHRVLHAVTIIDLQALFDRVRADREQGFSIVDEELERGLRALAVPVLDRSGQAVGAINLSTHSTRTTRNEMRERFLPELNRSRSISSMTV